MCQAVIECSVWVCDPVRALIGDSPAGAACSARQHDMLSKPSASLSGTLRSEQALTCKPWLHCMVTAHSRTAVGPDTVPTLRLSGSAAGCACGLPGPMYCPWGPPCHPWPPAEQKAPVLNKAWISWAVPAAIWSCI